MAFLISFLVIFALMLVYYNTGGWVANIALILNLLFTVGVLERAACDTDCAWYCRSGTDHWYGGGYQRNHF